MTAATHAVSCWTAPLLRCEGRARLPAVADGTPAVRCLAVANRAREAPSRCG